MFKKGIIFVLYIKRRYNTIKYKIGLAIDKNNKIV